MRLSQKLETLQAAQRRDIDKMQSLVDAAQLRDDERMTHDEKREYGSLKKACTDRLAEIKSVERDQQEEGANARVIEPDEDPFEPGVRFSGERSVDAAGLRKAIGTGLRRGLNADHIGRFEIPGAGVRTLLSSGASGIAVAGETAPTIPGVAFTAGRIISAIPVQTISAPIVYYNRLTWDTAGGASPAAAAVAQGQPKPQSKMKAVPQNAPLVTYATWEKISVQALQDDSTAQAAVEAMLKGAVLDVVSAAAYTTLTSAGNFSAYVGATGDSAYDAAVKVAGALATRGAEQIVVAMNPADVMAASLAKSANEKVYVGQPSALAGVRLVASADVASGKVLGFAGDKTGPTFYEREALSVAIGLDGNDWTTNLRTMLAEIRGLTVVRDPLKVSYGGITGA